MPDSGLTELLRKLRRRLLSIGLGAGAGWGLATWLGVLVLCAWLDLLFDLTPAMRATAVAAAFLAGVGVMLRCGLTALRRTSPPALGRRLDEVGSTGGQILSGIDLWLEQRPMPALTHGLSQLAVARAAVLARGVSGQAAIPARPVYWSSGALLAGLALCVAAALLAPRLAWTQVRRLLDPFGDHPPFSRIEFDVQPGDARAVYGSGLDVRVQARGGPVDRVELVMHSAGASADDVLPMFPEPGGPWRATIGNVTANSQYFVRAHSARSRKFNIEVITVPCLEAVRFRLTPPAYSNHPPYEGPLPREGLAGLRGTTVTMWARSNRPLSRGTAELSPGSAGQTVALQPAADTQEVTGSFAIQDSGQLRLQVFDVAGQPSQDPFAATITLLPDERPQIRILEPPPVSLATPDATLSVALAAEDDCGVSRVQLFRSLNDSRALPQDVELPAPPQQRWAGRVALPLSQYTLEPGDIIKLFARAEDNDPDGAKGAESPTIVVQIISQADFQKLLLAKQGMQVLLSKYQQAQRRMENLAKEAQRLADELAKAPPDSALTDAQRAELAKLHEQMREAADAIAKAADTELPVDIDKALREELKKLANELAKAAAESAAKCQGIPKASGAAEHLRELQERLAAKRERLQKEAVEPLEHLAKIFPLLQDEARFIALYKQQRDLADRLSSLKGRDDEQDPRVQSRMRELESEQRALREELGQLLSDIEEHAAALPDDPTLDPLRNTASKFAKAVRASDAAQQMTAAETGLAEFSGTRGHAGALAAADTLEKFLAECQGGMGEAGNCALKFQPKLGSCMGNSVGQLLEQMGMGMGSGGGSGYSATRTTAQNVGLYGNLPALMAAERSGSGEQALINPAVVGNPGSSTGNPNALEGPGAGHASGAADVPVPPQYRQRVGQYFQRIADESDQRAEQRR
jgi:hypothetical protein